MTTDSRLRWRLRRCLPWSDGSGRPWPGWLRSAPFCAIYLIASWVIFLPQARPVPGNWVIDTERVRPWLYDIPNLSQDFPRFLQSLVTATWLNHNVVQLAYVTLLLLLVGVRFEAREGTLRTMTVFFATTLVGAVVAGLLLHLLYPEFWSSPMAEKAWNRPWSGGSAGAFGLMGATAARAPVPWPLLAIFVLWEANVVYWYLHEYTPAFHISALFAGYLLTRYLLPARRASPARTAPGVSTQRRSSV
ncbi:MAG: rhomboid family intramembrane serine protease [Chloroflexia bacterium]|jgi:membrane associated rhomboid family serine protease|nr:rhomboid family intramembrane serine protease [Chloroflexia bacterium]